MAEAENLRLRAALAYASRSWFVFPCHTPGPDGACSCRHRDCQDAGKHPRTMNGFKDASIDEGQIRKWWGMWPDANVGIACGPSGLHVLDIDPRHGGDESLADLRAKHGEEWLATCIVQTGGGGTHYYYRAATPPLRNRAGVLPGIDVRGDGGYVVAPPSLHASGGVYAWEVTANETAPAEWPTWIVGGGSKRQEGAEVGQSGPIAMGGRNDYLTSLAGTLRRRGCGGEEIYLQIGATNQLRCEPPLPDSEVRKIANSVARFEPANDILLKLRGGAPTYSALRRHATEPPAWVIRVGESDVRVDTATLYSHRALCRAVLEQASLVLAPMKEVEWRNQLATLVANLEIVEAPEDASEGGIIWATVRDYLRLRSDNEERFGQGRPIERDGLIYATGAMIRGALRTNGVAVDQRKVWDVVRARGGANTSVHISGKQYRVWTIPAAVIE